MVPAGVGASTISGCRSPRASGWIAARATPERLAEFAVETVDELNRLRPIAQAQPWPDRAALVDDVAPGLSRGAPASSASATDVVAGVPKWSVLQPYFRWAGIDGVTNPFLPEVVVNHDLLPMEWAVHRGARVGRTWPGWRTRRRRATRPGSPARRGPSRAATARGSGRSVTSFAASSRERQLQLLSRLEDGPRRDLRAIAGRTAQSVRVVRRVSWATYDRYLKSNRVSEGLSSYDAAIVLVLAGLPESRHQTH